MRVGVTRTNGEPRIEQWYGVEQVIVDGTDNDTLIIVLSDGSHWPIPDDEYTTVVVLPTEDPVNDESAPQE
jgi:hypothetical protein